jgi:hypothetical protein
LIAKSRGLKKPSGFPVQERSVDAGLKTEAAVSFEQPLSLMLRSALATNQVD